MAMTEAGLAARIKANIEAITDFPTPGTNPLILDMRFINAVSKAIVDTLKTDAEVDPSGNGGAKLISPAGQSVTTPAGPGSTDAPNDITGKGKIL